jgi:exonuclease SbcC
VRFESLKQSGQRLAAELADAEKRSALAGQVPCDGTDLAPKCPLLTDAFKASSLILELETAVEEKRTACAVCADEQAGLTKQIEAYGDLPTVTSAKRVQHNEIRTQLTNAQELAAKAPLLEQARTEMDRANQERIELDDQRRTAGAVHDTNRGEIEQRIWDADQRVINEQDKSRLAVLTLQERLTELDTSDTADKIKAAENALACAETTKLGIEQTIQDKRATITRCDAQIEQLDSAIADADATRKQADAIEAELVSWRLLATGLGNDGIIALSIDDAGPTLASLTNELLLSAYGPRFTVSIVTQAQTKAGTDKETFDILVFDGVRDDQKSVRAMSGGERIWINECLTRAIALYQSQQSGRSYGCMFADESDGALDPERKEMFIRMKRKVLELGGYQREFFISHTPALWDRADAVIDMEQLGTA